MEDPLRWMLGDATHHFRTGGKERECARDTRERRRQGILCRRSLCIIFILGFGGFVHGLIKEEEEEQSRESFAVLAEVDHCGTRTRP